MIPTPGGSPSGVSVENDPQQIAATLSANKRVDVNVNSAEEGRGGSGHQERAAIMTRRHNNAFFQFSMQHRKRLTRDLRLPSHRITQILGTMWKELPDDQKLEFEKMAYQEQQTIMKEQNAYFKKHGLGIKNYDTIMFALSGPPSNATPEKKNSQDPIEMKDNQTSTTTTTAAAPASKAKTKAKTRGTLTGSARPVPPSLPLGEPEEAYHNIHRPNNKWDRQTQSGKIVFTEPLTLGKPREKRKLGAGGRSILERHSLGEGPVLFMPSHDHYQPLHHSHMGPPPPALGPPSRVKATLTSDPAVKTPSQDPNEGSFSRLDLTGGAAMEEHRLTGDAMDGYSQERENTQHGEHEDDISGYGHVPSTPYYSGPCYIPPSPYPLEPSLLNDSGDEEEGVEDQDAERYRYDDKVGNSGSGVEHDNEASSTSLARHRHPGPAGGEQSRGRGEPCSQIPVLVQNV
ncbi:hypothetical protein DFQ27_008713 [Actinomortierella ambigua]|uniref:HMG box domain-containing protein n=1 Tax=Actinomortierella ambigua TaxID=1343610 RepID=A0A9P6TY12_9FUNG|nr:hypothetical protein DFQ27_008713 [Actinomortierella ambigua]